MADRKITLLSMDALRNNMSREEIMDMIRAEAKKAGVPVDLALAVAEQESGFDPDAIGQPVGESRQRATGLFQLMPRTAKGLKVDPADVTQNIKGGVRYLRQLLDDTDNEHQALQRYGGVVNSGFKYAEQVLARRGKFKETDTAATPARSGGTVAAPAGAEPAQFQSALERVMQRMGEAGYPMKITSSMRTTEQQRKLFAQGRTKPGKIVTEADGVIKKSLHQVGKASDLDFLGSKKPWDLLGKMAEEEGLVWGGSWKTLKDYGHVQLGTELPPSDVPAMKMAAAHGGQQVAPPPSAALPPMRPMPSHTVGAPPPPAPPPVASPAPPPPAPAPTLGAAMSLQQSALPSLPAPQAPPPPAYTEEEATMPQLGRIMAPQQSQSWWSKMFGGLQQRQPAMPAPRRRQQDINLPLDPTRFTLMSFEDIK